MARSPISQGKLVKNKSQRSRFIKAAREAECSEDEAVFDRNLQQIAGVKPKPKKQSLKPRSSK